MTTSPTLSAAVIAAGRVVLRKAQHSDHEGLVEIFTDPEVRAYLGGPRSREEILALLDQIGAPAATAAPGSYVIADAGTDRLIGILGLGRRPPGRPGHVTGGGGELELSYVLRRAAWGSGLAFEAASAALRAAAAELPDQPVLVVTQTANQRARELSGRLGFTEGATFTEHDAEQILAAASLGSFRDA